MDLKGDAMHTTDRVQQILSWYNTEPTGVKANLHRLMMTGRLAGTGKLVILPVDQGFEHGPARSFAKVDAGYDPHYFFKLALDSGCNAYAAPLGFIETVAHKHAGSLPLILKVNNSDTLFTDADAPCSAITSSVEDALRLGASAIGYTIYPGSAQRNLMYEELRELIAEARAVGLPTIVWSYARGSGLSKAGETAIDVIAYSAHIACQLGAHVVKVKPPTAHIEQAAAKKVYEAERIPVETLTQRIAHVVQSCFGGHRVVIFSGGEAKSQEAVLDEIRGIHQGGGFGSIMGRNAFQRPYDEAIQLLGAVMDIYQS